MFDVYFTKKELTEVVPGSVCVSAKELADVANIKPLEKFTRRMLLVRRRGVVVGWFYMQIKEAGRVLEGYITKEEKKCLKDGFDIEVISKTVTAYFDFSGNLKVC